MQHQQLIDPRTTHREMIEHLCFTSKPYPMLISADRVGQISMWNPTDLRFIAHIHHEDKNKVFLDNMTKSMSTAQKAVICKYGAKLNVTKNNVMITALATTPASGHLCVGSVDCSVTVYDLATLEVNGRMTSLTDIPTAIEVFSIESDHRFDEGRHTLNTTYMAIGDSQGYLHVVELLTDNHHGIAQDAVVLKKKNHNVMSKAVDTLNSMKAHEKWITSVKYLDDLHQIVTSSIDGKINFMDWTKRTAVRTFDGHHCSVKCFSWSHTGKFICSGGADRFVLVWDPYTLDIICTLVGHSAPVVDVCVQDISRQLYTVTSDKMIRVWDLVTFELIQTVCDSAMYRPENKITAIHWSPYMKLLFTAGNRISIWGVERSSEDAVQEEKEDLRAALYNESFRQAVIVMSSGSVRVYNVHDGSVAAKFCISAGGERPESKSGGANGENTVSSANGNNNNISNNNNETKKDPVTGLGMPLIAGARLDKSERRLIICTTDNEIQLWNFNNGQCMKVIRPRIPVVVLQAVASLQYSVTALIYENVLGTARRDLRRFLIFGTDLGYACSLEERASIHEEPSFCLIRASNNRNPSDGAILWIEPVGENRIVIGYADGAVVLWDLDTTQRIKEMKADGEDSGVMFTGSRRKNSFDEVVPPEVDRLLGTLSSNANTNPGASTSKRAPSSMQKKSDIVAAHQEQQRTVGSPENLRDRPMSILDSFPYPQVVESTNPDIAPLPMNVSVSRLEGRIARTPHGSHHTGLTHHDMQQQLYQTRAQHATNTSLTEHNVSIDHIDGRQSASNPIGFPASPPKQSRPSTHGRAFAVASPSVTTMQTQPEKDVKSEVTTTNSLPSSSHRPGRRITTSSKKSAVSSLISNAADKKRSIVVDCAVVLSTQRVLIGACSDCLIRFWDMDTAKILCTSTYASSDEFAMEGDTLTHMKLGRTDLLVGGFENGSIKIWLITFRAIMNLKHPVPPVKYNLASIAYSSRRAEPISIPPLQLLMEWSAHASAVLSVCFVSLPEPGEPDPSEKLLEGQRDDLTEGANYIMSSGHDQEVHLWSLTGRMVGTFGPKGWDIDDKSTWLKRKDPNALVIPPATTGPAAGGASPQRTDKKSPKRNHSKRGSLTTSGSGTGTVATNQNQTPARAALVVDAPPSVEERALRIAALNAYVQELRAHPLRSTATAAHDEQFTEVLNGHPIADSSRMEAEFIKRLPNGAKSKKNKHLTNIEATVTTAKFQGVGLT